MPILKQPDDDAPLGQGDILMGLRLYATDHDWTSPQTPGGSPIRAEYAKYSIVLSRPCVILHKTHIVVASIDAVRGNVPENLKSVNEVRAFLNRLRDGYGQTDRFYLGQIPGADQGRYYAHLDSLHTITKPPETALGAFLKTNRVATLTEDFSRDLHLRILGCVASLGFDDYGWLSNQDLDWLARVGDAELLEKKTALALLRAKLSELQASGGSKNAKEVQGRETAIKELQESIDGFEQDLENYRQELQRRQNVRGSKLVAQ